MDIKCFYRYDYDHIGNVITLNPGGGYNWTYGYDNIYQVTSADQGSAANRAVDFSYDRVYNRTSWYDTQGNISVMYGKNSMNQYVYCPSVG